MFILAQAMQYELAVANSPRGSILLLRDLRHMAGLRSKFEIARVDHTKEKVYRNNFGLVVDKIAFPDAKWWQPF